MSDTRACELTSLQYFKSIEQVQAEQSTATPVQAQAATEEKIHPWRGAMKELRIETSKHQQMQEDGELTPDSMSSRLVDSAVAGLEDRKDELTIDHMASRVSKFAA